MNALSHPQRESCAFQLSEKQLESFTSLGTRGGAVDGAVTVIPFVKEPNARTEPTFVTDGNTPLRIYKNEYDKQEVFWWLRQSRCVIRQGDKSDPRAAQMEKAMKEVPRLLKELEQDEQSRQQAALSRQQTAPSQSESSLGNAPSPGNDASLSPKKDLPSTKKKDE